MLKQKGITRLLKLHGALMGQTHSILSSTALPAHRYSLTSISRKLNRHGFNRHLRVI